MDKHINVFLEQQKDDSLRILRPISSKAGAVIKIAGKEYVDFSSNDYLGLSNHPEMIKTAQEASAKYGTGSGGSRLLSGDRTLFHDLEDLTASFKGKPSSLVFNSGYQANTGIISALYSKGDAVFADKLVHASIIDGILLSGARLFRYRHNDMAHLEDLLKKESGNFKKSLIVTESVFSMDGDAAPLKDICALKERYGCSLMVDEAHATGVFGKNGSGLAEETGTTEAIDLLMGTFSKALGSFGAYLACPERVKQYLINTCRSFIYSTALPPGVIACNIKAIELVRKEDGRRKKVLMLSSLLRDGFKAKGLKVLGCTQIIPVLAGENARAVKMSQDLKNAGIRALPIRYPTVPKGEARIRFSVNYDHTDKMIKDAVNAIGNG